MNYNKKELKKGVTLHTINTNKFKTNLFAVFLAVPLEKENVTKDALVASILRRGTQNIQSQELISKKLEEMYGACFDCGIEKTGDNHVIKFYLEAINEEFLPQKEELTKECMNILFDIIFNPLIEKNGFKNEYVESEKKNLKQIIESKIDNKRIYSFERCVEEMFKDEPYGLYKYGYVEDLDNLTPQNLYEHYKNLINRCKVDIFISGTLENKVVENIIKNTYVINNLKERMPEYIVEEKKSKQTKEAKTVEEHMQVGQGNLVIGLNVNSNQDNSKFITSVYNAILGGGANSKLFQNVREKEGLAYSAGSNFVRVKDSIFIRCGIEIDKYNKALETIKEQLEDIKNGNFTEEDMNSAKKLITSSMKSIAEEQDTEITYYYGQDLSGEYNSLEEYIEKINKVTRNEVVELSKNIKINTIYFLRD